MTHEQFTEAYRDHAPKLHSYLMRLQIRPDSVPDLCQEAWAKAWEHRDNITPAALGSWVKTTARNIYIDQYRHRAHHTDQLPEHYDKAAPSPSPLSVLLAKQAAAVADPILIDAYVFGFSMAEIADSLGIPTATAKTNISRAKQKARLALS